MLINKKVILAAVVALSLGSSSCKKFMGVNTNPNVSQIVTVQTLLPAAQLHIGSAVGADLQIYGSIWSQFWTQTPGSKTYASFEQYAPAQTDFESAWTNLYVGAENFYQLSVIADSLHKKQYKAISLLMQAYTFQVLTDGWGDVPFKQALHGQVADGHKINPQYDSQMVVYKGIIAYLDSANKLLNVADAARPGTDDIIYNGDMNRWRKFSNTLRLKVLLRQAYIDPVGAKAKINAFYITSPQFIADGDDAKITYGGGTGNKNPLFAELTGKGMGVQDLGASKTALDSLTSNNDPRRYAFYSSTGSGIPQGSYSVPMASGAYAIPSGYVGADINSSFAATAPVNLLTSSESYFMQAEVAARGWGNATVGDDSLFYWGIKSSFTYYSNQGISMSSYYGYVANGKNWTIYPATGTIEDKVRAIITQKWFAMCGNQGFEAWSELRRTGYPDFVKSPASSTTGAIMPKRFLYPATESSANAGFPKSGIQPVTTKVWWDVF